MTNKEICNLADASGKLYDAASNIEYLKEASESRYEIIPNLFLVEFSGMHGINRKFHSTRGTEFLKIPQECWKEIQDILLRHYAKAAEEAYKEVSNKK